MLSILALVVFIIAIFIIMKMTTIRRKFYFIAIAIILLLLFTSFDAAYSKTKVNLTNFEGFVSAGKVYLSWIGHAFTNVRTISSYAVKQDWSLPNKSINITT